MKRVLITGGAGFIGSHCVDQFLSAGYEVGVFDIKSRAAAVNLTHVLDQITYIEGDIRDIRQLDSVLGMYDSVLHLAAIVSVPESIDKPVETHATNVTGTLNVLESAVRQGVERVVYASSAAVYGDTKLVPTPETAPLSPVSPYGLHKVMNESYAALYEEQYGLNTTGLRFFNVYGSRQDPSSPYSGVISIFGKRMQDGVQPIVFGDGSATRDFVHVSDVANVCLAVVATRSKTPMVCNVGTGKSVTLTELVSTLNTLLGTKIKSVHESKRDADIMHSCCVPTEIKKTFSCQARIVLADGLRETLQVMQR